MPEGRSVSLSTAAPADAGNSRWITAHLVAAWITQSQPTPSPEEIAAAFKAIYPAMSTPGDGEQRPPARTSQYR